MRILGAISLIVALAWSGVASAGSTINPSVPANNSPLTSGPVRGNFQAAFADVNGIEGMFAGPTAPPSPLQGQDWLNTSSSTAATWSKWNVATGTWTLIGTFNLNTGAFTAPVSACPTCALLNAANTFTAVQTINLNASPLQAAQAGATLRIGQANTVVNRLELDSYAAVSRFTGVRADGNAAIPSALQANEQIVALDAWGYNGSTFVGSQAAFRTFASQNWSVGATGTRADIALTPNGASVSASVASFYGSGGVSISSSPVDPGIVGLAIGAGVALPGTSLLMVNANTVTPLGVVVGGEYVLANLVAPNSDTGVVLFDAYGPASSTNNNCCFDGIAFRRADGTSVSPTPVAAGDILGVITAHGNDGNTTSGQQGYSLFGAAQIRLFATENWAATGTTSTNNGAGVQIYATPTGSPTSGNLTQIAQFFSQTAGIANLNIGIPGTSQGKLLISSPVANSMFLTPASSASGTATIPSGTYNLLGDTPSATLTNKTIVSSTDVLGGVTMTLGSDAEGDIYYRHSGVLTRLAAGGSGTALEISGGVPVWAAVPGTGTVTSVTITGSGGNVVSGTCPSAITTSGTCQLAAPGGFLNFLRNSSMSAWFHGTTVTITTAGGWCAEGVWVIPTGASVTCAQTATTLPGSLNNIKITGNTSVTDVIVRYVVESYTVARFFSKNVTFQMGMFNQTGGTVTATLQSKFPTAGVDNWSGTNTTDLSATNMQACTNGSNCGEAYTLAVTGSTANGYEFNVDLGNNFSTTGKSVTISYFDARIDNTASTGLNSNPPPYEVRDAASDITWNERFFQGTYDNNTAPGAATHAGIVGTSGSTSSNNGEMGNSFRTTMRCDPVINYWDGAGNASKYSFFNNSTWTDNNAVSGVGVISGSPGHNGFVFYNNLPGNLSFHYTADCTISGG